MVVVERSAAQVRVVGNLSKLRDGSYLDNEMIETPVKLGSILSILNQKYSLGLNRQNILVLVNGIEANALSNLETMINAGDQIVILPMFHGG